MSWQTYVDTNLVGTGKIAKAAILGLQGGVWAKSPGFEIPPAEQKAVVDAFTKPDDVRAHGIRVANEKYFTLQANDRSIYGKKQADGIVLVKTKQAVVVAVYVAPNQAGEVTKIVEELADYLIGAQY